MPGSTGTHSSRLKQDKVERQHALGGEYLVRNPSRVAKIICMQQPMLILARLSQLNRPSAIWTGRAFHVVEEQAFFFTDVSCDQIGEHFPHSGHFRGGGDGRRRNKSVGC
jgi:hypothetical protein